LIISSDPDTIISCSSDSTIKTWTLRRNSIPIKTLTGYYASVESLLCLNSLSLASSYYDGTLAIWNLELGKIKSKLFGHIACAPSMVLLEKFYLASASYDNTIKIWNWKEGVEMRTVLAHSDIVFSIVLLKNGFLASSSGDRLIKIWNYTSGHLVDTFRGHSNQVRSLFPLKSGNLASASLDGDIKIWHCSLIGQNKVKEKRLFRTSPNKSSPRDLLVTINVEYPVLDVLLLDDERLVIADASPNISIWNFKKRLRAKALIGHLGQVKALCHVKDDILASASTDMTIKIWNSTSGEILKSLRDHKNIINDIIWLKHQQYLVSCSKDETIKMWNITNGKIVKTLYGNQGQRC
jgi:WD40 repeat protein